jgi:DNA topoisomerase-1
MVTVRNGRYGPYVTEDAEDGEKPRTASLFKSMSPETVTLEEVLPLFMLPRTVGTDPATGEEIVVSNGRYGPYLKRGADTRSLESEEQLLTLTLDEALAVLAQPKQRGRRASTEPLRDLGGNDPVSGKPLVIKKGRFGPYVTDGETNASLRTDDDVETLTLARAAELMQARRERGPAAPKGKRKS